MDSYEQNRDTNRVQGWLFVLGIVQIVLGFLVITFSIFTTLLTIVVLGIFLIFRGIADLFHTVPARRNENFWWRLFGAVLSLIVGFLLILRPVVSLASLTLLIGAFFVTIGVIRAIAASILRFPNWGWVVFSGFAAIVLGALVLAEWPQSSLWLIGMLLGVELLIHGLSLIMQGTLPGTYQKNAAAFKGA